MKTWQSILLGIFLGVVFCAVLRLIDTAPRGNPVTLQPAPSPVPLLVHVSGAVQQPGVYALPEGARMAQAVEAAGGFAAEADQSSVNLAARLNDGEKLSIPVVGAELPQQQSAASLPGTARALTIEDNSPGLVNINTASLEELMTLPGIGETKAGNIIAYRQEHGGFESIEELDEVSGIGEATLKPLLELVTVE